MKDDIAPEAVNRNGRPGLTFARTLPLLILGAGLAAFFLYGGADYVKFEMFRENRAMLLDLVARNGILSALLFVAAYAVMTALSLPGGLILSLVGGFLFGVVLGSFAVVIGATLGAVVLFLAARTALGDPLRARAGPALRKMEGGFRKNAVNYMLFLRLVPVFPFWLVNLVPAFMGVSLKVFVATTFIGIIPGTVVYTSIGNGLGAVFDMGGTPDLGIIFDPEIFLPLVGVAILSLVPVIHRKLKARHA